MVLMKFSSFVFFEILSNLVSMRNHLNANICKILKIVQRDLTFIFDVLSEYVIRFMPNAVYLAAEDVVSFP